MSFLANKIELEKIAERTAKNLKEKATKKVKTAKTANLAIKKFTKRHCLFAFGFLFSIFLIQIQQAQAATINIIIDDLGYAKTMDKKFLDLDYENISYSFLPDAYFTPSLVNYAFQKSKTILIHMPMQAIGKVGEEESTLKVGMSDSEIYQKLDFAFSRVPNALGLNGHQGSLFTADRKSMQILMKWLDAKGLYFIDSRTTKDTQAAKVAQEFGVPNISRQVFLDHKSDEASIRKEWQRLIKIAQKYGNAVAIGHPNSTTLKVLQEELPKLKQKNISIASLGFSIRRQNSKIWSEFYAKNRKGNGAYAQNQQLFADNSSSKSNGANNSRSQNYKSSNFNGAGSVNSNNELSIVGTKISTRSAAHISANNDGYFFTTPYEMPKIIAYPLSYSFAEIGKEVRANPANTNQANQAYKNNYVLSRDAKLKAGQADGNNISAIAFLQKKQLDASQNRQIEMHAIELEQRQLEQKQLEQTYPKHNKQRQNQNQISGIFTNQQQATNTITQTRSLTNSNTRSLTRANDRGLEQRKNFVEKSAQNLSMSQFAKPKPNQSKQGTANQTNTKQGIQRHNWNPTRRKID